MCVCQHAVLPLSGHQEESAAGRVAGTRTAGVHHRRGGGQTDHPHVAEEVPQAHPSRKSHTHDTWCTVEQRLCMGTLMVPRVHPQWYNSDPK